MELIDLNGCHVLPRSGNNDSELVEGHSSHKLKVPGKQISYESPKSSHPPSLAASTTSAARPGGVVVLCVFYQKGGGFSIELCAL